MDKCSFLHGTNPLFKRQRTCEDVFIIRHYAGEVNYQVRSFLDKNRDLLRSDVIDMFIDSKNQVGKLIRIK